MTYSTHTIYYIAENAMHFKGLHIMTTINASSLFNSSMVSAAFDSAITALSLADEQTHRYCPIVGYGLRNGGIGCIELTRDEPVILWSLEGA
jgi:hypothetical protein